MLMLVTELYPQLIRSFDTHRKQGILKFRTAIWAIVGLFSPNEVEKLLRSNVSIDKSDDYIFLRRWLGHGLLTRYS